MEHPPGFGSIERSLSNNRAANPMVSRCRDCEPAAETVCCEDGRIGITGFEYSRAGGHCWSSGRRSAE